MSRLRESSVSESFIPLEKVESLVELRRKFFMPMIQLFLLLSCMALREKYPLRLKRF